MVQSAGDGIRERLFFKYWELTCKVFVKVLPFESDLNNKDCKFIAASAIHMRIIRNSKSEFPINLVNYMTRILMGDNQMG